MIQLTLKNVSKYYNSNKILDRISFTVRDGEFIAIVGPSGCGKTTLLNTIAGFIGKSEGQIIMEKKVIRKPNRKIGMMFQDHNLMSWKTVSENILFSLRIKGENPKKCQSILNKLLKKINLEKYKDYYPSKLSIGMQQRVALARTFAMQPKILLMDEPFNALDAITRIQMQDLLLKIWSKSKNSVLFITHDIREAILLADKIIVLTKLPGRIKKIINVKFTRPRNPKIIFSKEFRLFEESIINLINEEQSSSKNNNERA